MLATTPVACLCICGVYWSKMFRQTMMNMMTTKNCFRRRTLMSTHWKDRYPRWVEPLPTWRAYLELLLQHGVDPVALDHEGNLPFAYLTAVNLDGAHLSPLYTLVRLGATSGLFG